jgi:hypothetical protein
MRRRHVVLVVLASLLVVPASRAQTARHLAAPPSDITQGVVVLPEPASLAVSSTYAVLEPDWRRDGDAQVASLALPVERAGRLSLALVGVGADGWGWELAEPGAVPRDVAAWVAEGRARRVVGAVAPGDPRDAVGLEIDAAAAGGWTIGLRAPADADVTAAWLVARTAGADDVVLRSHLGTHALLSDRAIAVVARFESEAGPAGPAAGPPSGLVRVEAAGARWTQPLADDGLHGDGAAGDGVLGAWIGPLPPGAARVAVQVDGTVPGVGRDGAGLRAVRTVHHAFTVEEPAVRLSGTAGTAVLDAHRLAIDVGLQPLAALRRVHLSAEVWGTDVAGAAVPVAWLSHIGLPAETYGTTSLSLHLDGRWLARAGTTEPLGLRRVRVQDPDSHVLFDARDALPLPAGALPPAALAPAVDVTPDMLLGVPRLDAPTSTLGLASPALPGTPLPPGPPLPPPGTSPGLAGGLSGRGLLDTAWKRALMLSHGYCSGGNIWPPADFTEPKLVFLDPDQNRSNDEFAQLLAAAGAGKDAFGFVGHSQGGLAAVHLLTYYQSGLDFAIGPRRIQSVASPYQGTPLASLGFFACGVNDDMTTSGAPVWLAGIPSWARQEVHYWTTQNSGSVCNFFTDLVLASPNDGTVERDRGQLPGAHSMGHVAGWCHTTGMSNPANYLDHARNAEMNSEAAR